MRSPQRLALLFLLCGSVLPAAAEVPASDTWVPTSRSAQTITGSVTLGSGQITFQNGGVAQVSKPIQMLYRPEKKAKKVLADLYRVIASPIPETGSKVCGDKAVAYLIVWKPEKQQGGEADTRTIVAFSGPKFDPASPDECARFVYDARRR